MTRLRASKALSQGHWPVYGMAVAALLVGQALLWGPNPIGWDWLLVSGVVVFLGALRLSWDVPRLVIDTLGRLQTRGVIAEPASDGAGVSAAARELERTARRYRPWGATAAATLMLLGWVYAAGGDPYWGNWALWLTVALAAVAGVVLARLTAYGGLARVLVDLGMTPQPQPGHVDRAAGLRPVGELYLRQATVVAAIGVFAGVWWLLIGVIERYAYWRDPYLILFVLAIGLELLIFFAPLWSFHRLMAAARAGLLTEADQTSRRIRDLGHQLTDTADASGRERLEGEIARLTQRWSDIEEMPTWPVDAGMRRRFTWNNVMVAVPFVLKALSAPRGWQEVGEGLTKLFA